MKKQKIGKKMLVWLMVLALLLIICTCFAVGLQFKNEKMNEYRTIAFAYAKAAADFIDGDKVLTYLETNTEDDYYQEVKQYLNTTLSNSTLKYFYVFVPQENDLVYIWDADNDKEACPLGYHEMYMKGGKESSLESFRDNPPEKIRVYRDETYGYIAAAFYPIFSSEGEPVALVGVDMSMPGIQQSLFNFIISIVISIVSVILLAMGGFFIFVRRNIIHPINQLNKVTNEMVCNLQREESICIDVHTGDEIEELAKSFTEMDAELRDYIRKLSSVTAEKEHIKAELDIATQIQISMLPCIFPAFPERKEIDIYATMDPAKEVGGDFYDFFMVDDTHLAIVVADVSGKGVPAALFMVIGKTLIKDHTLPGVPLGQVFTEVNDLLCEANKEGLFITAFEAVLDLTTGEMEYVNAGHEYPFICRYGEEFKSIKLDAGFVLAGMEGMRYQSAVMQLAPGDRIFQYTDGVTEATNAEYELYGMERLEQILNTHKYENPKELLCSVRTDIDLFVKEAPQFDDITMLCLEFKSKQ